MRKLNERFELSEANFKSLEEDLKLNIKLQAGDSSSDLISYLNKEGFITHFNEVIPSASDIFIQTVNQNS